MTIAVHPGAVHHPAPGVETCATDDPGDGRAHVRLSDAAERDRLAAAAFHGRWRGYTTVTYVAWWPEQGILWERDGIPESRGGALIATFAEFPARLAGIVAATLERIRSGASSSVPVDDTIPIPGTVTTARTVSESSDQMEHDLNDVSYISGGPLTVESTYGFTDSTTVESIDGFADGSTDGDGQVQ